ncbi:MAG TPA: protoporphyrinogen oxidase [Desulfobacteria bacterium]|nr:protoporphyrinogen oxidase [Desulfobacteria bacterium]
MKKVIIIGGGITGLAAAYHLQEKAKEAGLPLDYVLIEKDRTLGGKIVTYNDNGFVLEGGPDCFVREKPSVIQMCERVGITDKLLPSNDASTGTFVLCGGKLHQLPDGLMLLVPTKIVPFALSPLISWPGKLRMGLDFILPRRKEQSDESLASFVTRRLGKEALDKIGEPLIGGIHGSNSQTMSLKASFPRFLKMEADYRSLIVAMLAARHKSAKQKQKTQPLKPGEKKKTYFMSFKGGMSDLVNGIVAKLDPAKVLTGCKVNAIEKLAADKYRVAIEGREPLEADAVIITSPAWDTAELLANLDHDVAVKLREIPQASSATINLIFKRKDVPGDLGSFGFVIPASEKQQLNALTYSSVKWDYRVPDATYVSIRTFVGGGRNQELALLPDEQLIDIAKRELAKIIGLRGEPVLARVNHWTEARPQYVLGHLDRIKFIDDKLAAANPGIALAGASYRGIGVPDCINDGLKAVEQTINRLTLGQNCEAAR